MKTFIATLLILSSFSVMAARVNDGYGMSLKDYHTLLEKGQNIDRRIEDASPKADEETFYVCTLKTKRDRVFEGEGFTKELAEMETRKQCQSTYSYGCSTGKVKCQEFLNY